MESKLEFKDKKSLKDNFRDCRILLVDDMQNMRRTMKNMLQHLGIKIEHIVEANDGEAALKILQEEDHNIIFVLLDWNMPNLTGIDVLKKIKEDEKLRKILVLMVTAENSDDQIAQAVERGVENYIIKPFIAKTLEEKMLNIINPPEYLKLINKGEELLKQGEHDKALTIFEELLITKPDSASIRILMGQAYEEKKNYVKAHQLYNEAIEKNPQYLRAHNTLANFLLKRGDKKAALSSLEKAAEISPTNPNRHLMIGKLALESEKNPEKAEQALKKAVKQSPEMAEEAAEIFLKNGCADKAEDLLRKSITQNESVHKYNRLGIALRKQGKWKEAVEEYQKALIIAPDNEVIHFNMGMAYLEGSKIVGGNKQKAYECFKKALEINPDLKEAENEIKKC